mmetsp:Transcript_47290/g.112591  ORF Transcript_47290/g.112591 Transcript_47290/m.112591 type:complete len:380 (-) Transcript_47290:375-1514(-)
MQNDVDLRLELRHHQGSAPAERTLPTDHVRKHVVANVDELLASHERRTKKVVQMLIVAPLEHLPRGQRHLRRVEKSVVHVREPPPVVGMNAEEREVFVLEERWLARSNDHQVEKVEPIKIAILQLGVSIDVIHDHVRVVPQRVCQEKHLAARALVPLEHLDDAWLRLDVLARILCNSVLDDAIAMAEINRLAHVLVDLLVRLGLELLVGFPVLVDEGYEVREHKGVRQREERVDVRELSSGVVLLVETRIEVRPLPLGQRGGAVEGDLAIHVSVHLDDVPPRLVDDESSLIAGGVVVRKVEDLLGIPHVLHQLLHGAAVGEDLKRLWNVLGEGVVHIEANRLDPLHVQRSVAENLASVLFRRFVHHPIHRHALSRLLID